MAEILAVVALRKAILGFVYLHFNYDTTKVFQLKDILRFIRPL
jgi:hypothetical protein